MRPHDRRMKTIMKLDKLTIEQMELFLAGSQPIAFSVADTKDERYKFVDGVLKRYAYSQLKRHDKSIVIQFLAALTNEFIKHIKYNKLIH